MSTTPHKEESCYFNLPQSKDTPSEPSTPISPGTSPPPPPHSRASPRSLLRDIGRRARSDYSAGHARVHVQAIEEDLPDHLPAIHTSTAESSALNTACATKNAHSDHNNNYTRSSPTNPSVSQGSDNKQDLRLAKENHAYPPRRPRLGHTWARTHSGSVWFESQKAQAEHRRSSSSSCSNVPSRHLPVRTEQMPLKPPSVSQSSQSFNVPALVKVKVETDFTELDGRNSANTEQTSGQATFGRRGSGSRRKSSSSKLIFSAPLTFIRRLSLPKRSPKVTFAPVSRQSPVPTKPTSRLTDHPSLLKRNYTNEALQRVTAILQETRLSAPASSWLPVIRPLKLRSPTERTAVSRGVKGVETVQGITSRFTMSYTKSVEALSPDVSTTSGDLYNGPRGQLTNTPAEEATYKIKRSPSAETEEFLKVDISIYGGTSYLPSEARRIHTPPLPEETQDGKLKGFFFDYNAPMSARRDPLHGSCSHNGQKGSCSTASAQGKPPNRPTTMGQNLSQSNSKKDKPLHARGWYDMKLAELDVAVKGGQYPENGDSRLISRTEVCPAGERKDEEQFDYNIPEHLPSSPLCPRNPRYWRIMKGKGSQFRGCWMHGIGEYESSPGLHAG